MKRFFRSTVFSVILFALLPVQARAAERLIPVGEVIGLHLKSDTVIVAAYDSCLGEEPRRAGLKIGDEIIAIGSVPVEDAQDVRSALEDCGETVRVTVRRDGKLDILQLTPQQTPEGPKLGVYLRQGMAGIGTVTFYDPDTGLFGTLGHGVSGGRGKLLEMTGGNAYEASVLSVVKGTSGEPGQLKGSAEGERTVGTLLRNTPQGVFGIARQRWQGEACPVADYEEIHTGEATIRSTICGRSVQEYSVEIHKIYPEDRSDGRNFLIKVTDPTLLEQTGGIVQGMSGSPIIQDGKLVGAVTHVLVNDPTRGYGIFIENMLEAAQ